MDGWIRFRLDQIGLDWIRSRKIPNYSKDFGWIPKNVKSPSLRRLPAAIPRALPLALPGAMRRFCQSRCPCRRHGGRRTCTWVPHGVQPDLGCCYMVQLENSSQTTHTVHACISIYIYIHLKQRKPNFLQDKYENLVFSQDGSINVVFTWFGII